MDNSVFVFKDRTSGKYLQWTYWKNAPDDFQYGDIDKAFFVPDKATAKEFIGKYDCLIYEEPISFVSSLSPYQITLTNIDMLTEYANKHNEKVNCLLSRFKNIGDTFSYEELLAFIFENGRLELYTCPVLKNEFDILFKNDDWDGCVYLLFDRGLVVVEETLHKVELGYKYNIHNTTSFEDEYFFSLMSVSMPYIETINGLFLRSVNLGLTIDLPNYVIQIFLLGQQVLADSGVCIPDDNDPNSVHQEWGSNCAMAGIEFIESRLMKDELLFDNENNRAFIMLRYRNLGSDLSYFISSSNVMKH